DHSLDLSQAIETVDGQLAQIENDTNKAKLALAEAIRISSASIQSRLRLDTVLQTRFAAAHMRYVASLKIAEHMAFLAKRSIEMRRGVHLRDLQDDLLLVQAPAKWESTLCSTTGIDYAQLQQGTFGSSVNLDPAYFGFAADADPFIGDYVKRL